MAERDSGNQNGWDFDRAFPATAGSSSPRTTQAHRDRRLVLIVDDNRDCADSLQMLLSTFGYEVHVAYEGHTAMRMFNATPYGAVLLDLTMPEMHGFELARRLRMSSSACPPIIAISGWADARTKGQARDAGIDSYIVKPADIDELQRLLAGIGRKEHGSEDAWISPV